MFILLLALQMVDFMVIRHNLKILGLKWDMNIVSHKDYRDMG